MRCSPNKGVRYLRSVHLRSPRPAVSRSSVSRIHWPNGFIGRRLAGNHFYKYIIYRNGVVSHTYRGSLATSIHWYRRILYRRLETHFYWRFSASPALEVSRNGKFLHAVTENRLWKCISTDGSVMTTACRNLFPENMKSDFKNRKKNILLQEGSLVIRPPWYSLVVPVTLGRGSSAPTAAAGRPHRACSIIAQAQALSSRRRMPMQCGRAALRVGP
jgi:hypothetical protein